LSLKWFLKLIGELNVGSFHFVKLPSDVNCPLFESFFVTIF